MPIVNQPGTKMYDTDNTRTEDIELILSMATMLVSGEDEAEAGLGKFQEQWAKDELDLPGLKAFMAKLCREDVIAKDMLKDIAALIDKAVMQEQPQAAEQSFFGRVVEQLRHAGSPQDLAMINMIAGTSH